MLKIAIMGAGRMGSLIRSTAETMRDAAGEAIFDVAFQVDRDLSDLDSAPAVDVLVDFSHASCLEAVVAYARRSGAALVCGTTGLTAAQMGSLRALGAHAAVLHSGNYSIGIAALRHLVGQAARELPGFDVEIVECHHNKKVDAPSGTAKLLLDTVLSEKNAASAATCAPTDATVGGYRPVYGRESMCGARDEREVGVHALRGGTVAGVHTVSFFGTDEELSLTHRATSRQIFVDGALAAALKLADREPGFYTFDEIMFA